MKPLTIISDFDEVIARCDLTWINKIRDRHKEFDLDYNDERFLLSNINNREKYYINEYFNINTPEKLSQFRSLYYNDLNFYDNAELLPVGKLLTNFSLFPKKFKIVILSVSAFGLETNIAKSKLNFIKKNFNYDNIEIHLVDSDKSKIIKELYPDWDQLFEDSLAHIEKIINVTDLTQKKREILIPAYGWNKDNSELKAILEDTQISMMYYFK
jgi:hypothetical protein